MSTIKKVFRKLKGYCRNIFKTNILTLEGVLIDLNLVKASKNLRWFFYFEKYEVPELQILKSFLSSDDIVMEIGSGIGFLSTFCAKKIGSNRVHTYEANPQLKEVLFAIYKMNNVSPETINAVLGKEKSQIDFYCEPDFWASSLIQRSQEAKKVKVEVLPVSLEEERIQPTFLIMDIEGGEIELLPLFNLASVKKVLIELHPHVTGLKEANSLISLLLSKGFILDFMHCDLNVLYFKKEE